MRRRIEDGIQEFLDEEYPTLGYKRWTELLELQWNNKAAYGREFGVTREQIRTWIKAMVDQGLWNEEKYGPALTVQNSKT